MATSKREKTTFETLSDLAGHLGSSARFAAKQTAKDATWVANQLLDYGLDGANKFFGKPTLKDEEYLEFRRAATGTMLGLLDEGLAPGERAINSADAKQFRKNVKEAYSRSLAPEIKAVREGRGERYLDEQLKKDREAITSILSGSVAPSDPLFKQYEPLIQEGLDRLSEKQPMMNPDPNSFITREEYARTNEQYATGNKAYDAFFPPANYRLNEAGQEQWQTQRDYDLLRALRTDRHAPPYASSSSNFYGAVSNALAPVNFLLSYAAADGGTSDDPAEQRAVKAASAQQTVADTQRQFSNQMSGSILSRIRLANEWWQRGANAEETRDRATGANFPSLSVTTPSGLSQYQSNAGSLYGRALNYTRAPFFDLSSYIEREFADLSALEAEKGRPATTGETAQAVWDALSKTAKATTVKDALYRDTPVIPTESARSAASTAIKNLNKKETSNWERINAYAPGKMHLVNELAGQELITPQFLSKGANLLANLPAEVLSDPETLLRSFVAPATLPLVARNFTPKLFPNAAAKASPLGIAKGAAKLPYKLTKQVGDELPVEGPLEFGEYVGDGYLDEGESVSDWLFKPSAPTGMENVDPSNKQAYKNALARLEKQRRFVAEQIDAYATGEAYKEDTAGIFKPRTSIPSVFSAPPVTTQIPVPQYPETKTPYQTPRENQDGRGFFRRRADARRARGSRWRDFLRRGGP